LSQEVNRDDGTWFKEVHELYQPSLFRVAFFLLRPYREAAEDVVAETLKVAWEKRSKLPDDPGPWLFGTLRRKVKRWHSEQNAQREIAVRLVATGEDLAPSDQEAFHLAADWKQLTGTLTAADQLLLWLIHVEDLPHATVAAIFSSGWYRVRPLTEDNVAQRNRRALAKLRADADVQQLRDQQRSRRHRPQGETP
jgi:DNA-directed RNA polymerase specialized sigma24 family protein